MKPVRILAAVLALTAPALAAHAQTAKVAVTAIVEHPALDATRDGVRDALIDAGYRPGETLEFIYESAQGNPATAVQIARQFVGERPDVIVPISTPSAQAVVAATKDIPVVFTAVTDPVAAQLVTSMEASGGNVTGLSDLTPINDHLALICEVLPDARQLGVIYNPGEANAVSLVRLLQELAPQHGFTVVESTATKSADVLAAARALVGKVQAIYVPTDNTIVSALEAVLSVGRDQDIPVFTGDTDSVERGAVASLGFDYYQVGRQTGEIVVRILRGEAQGSIPVRVAQGTDLYVNPEAAAAMGITLPEPVVQRATKVVGQ